ncbi:MAG: hypothetical protein ACFNZD_00885 [Candidatus Nanoperiomorbus sp.]
MSTGGRYLVQFDPYTKNHFIKSITKRYSSRQWQATRKSLEFVLEHIDQHILTDKAKTIHASDVGRIVKLYFKIAGTKDSARESGNRAIVFLDDTLHIARVLLVYSKKEICQPNETVKWQKAISEQFPEIMKKFPGC